MKLSIIMVNFNTRALTAQCITSVLATTKTPLEIIVVDNSTKFEEKYAATSGCVCVIHAENRGFGHACNIGMNAACGEYFLLLNSDTIVHLGAIDTCIEYISAHEEVGALGCKTLLADGSLDHNCKRGLPTPAASLYYLLGLDKKYPKSRKYAAYHATYLDENEINEVEVLSGAFMLLPRKVIEVVGTFDERFFMYCEDVDLCYRITQGGFKLIYLPTAAIMHLKGQSGLHTRNRAIIRHFHRSMLLFYKKHFRLKYNGFINLLMYTGIYLKMWLELLKSLFI